MPTGMWIALAIMLIGQFTWLIAAQRAKAWLTANDPTHQPESVAARLFIGQLFTSFGPVSRYAALRRERGEDTTLTTAFWSGLAISLAGLIFLFVQIGQL